jgi:nicotinate phosphoribosyltransferase
MSVLLTDLYQLTMLHVYHRYDMTKTAVFELFVRKLPEHRGFLMAAGLEQAVEFLETLHFDDEDLEYLRRSKRFPGDVVDWFGTLRFTGDVDAMPEGTVFFADEPVLRITAPLPEAQLVETRLLNLIHFETLIASKAARMMLAAPGKRLFDFGLRRAHGAEAGLLAARASYIAGFEGTATVLAEERFGIPIFGTMAHSFVEAHASERLAFEHFARTRPKNITLLIDTYDTESAADDVVAVAKALAPDGIVIGGVRLDSGDLLELSKRVRATLDADGLSDTAVFASGGLDEYQLLQLMRANAPIDGFGLGTSLATSSDAPALECAYKLQEYDGEPRRKLSAGKASWPGAKQVWRRIEGGTMSRDLIAIEGEPHDGFPLLEPVMRGGKRVGARPTLEQIRERARAELQRLPEALAQLESVPYAVEIAPSLQSLAKAFDERLATKLGR